MTPRAFFYRYMLELNDKECDEILSFFVVDSFNTSSKDGKKKRGSINIGLNYIKLQLCCIFLICLDQKSKENFKRFQEL